MTAAVMETTLRERALELVREAEAKLEERRVAEARERFERELKELVADVANVTDSASVEISIEDEHPIATTADGVRFSMQKPSVAHRSGGWDLCVAVDCERHCGKPLWMMAGANLLSLGYVLATEHRHDFDCLQQFDENGDPTTDRWGTPLRPVELGPVPPRGQMPILPVVHQKCPGYRFDQWMGETCVQRTVPDDETTVDTIILSISPPATGHYTTYLTPAQLVAMANTMLTDEERAFIARGAEAEP